MIVRSVGMLTFINVLKGIISLLLSFYLAKAVSPAEFGLIAFAIPLAALITLLTDLGIANAIVRERSLDKEQSGSAFVMMLAFGLVGGLALVLLAVPIQWASGLPRVQNVVVGFAVVACFSVWATCPRALIERELEYKVISAVELAALVVATGVFFLTLRSGWGIFALVAFHIAMQCIRSVLFIWFARSLFTWVLIPRGITPLLQTGGWIFGSNLLSYASRNLDRFIIATYLGAAAVGLYGFAYQFLTIPLVLLAWPASGVLMSSLSRLDHDVEGKRKVVEGFIVITAGVVFPLMALITFQSGFPLQALLSENWRGIDVYISLLAPLGAIQAIAVYASATLVANGHIRLNFKLSVMNGAFVPIGFFLSVPYGLLTAIYVYIAISSAICSLMIFHMCKVSNISINRCINLFLPGLSAMTIVALTSLVANRITVVSPVMQWLISASFSLLGALSVAFLFRSRLIHHVQVLSATRIGKAQIAV